METEKDREDDVWLESWTGELSMEIFGLLLEVEGYNTVSQWK